MYFKLKTMKAVIISIFLCLLFLLSCNKKSGQQAQQQQAMQDQARQQAIQDSIAVVQAKREAQLAAQREQERMSGQNGDTTTSTANAAANSKPINSGLNQEIPSDTFTPSGDYALQVSAWRSQWKAQEELKKWRERGYDQAYLMKAGNEETGNIWYRVRLGHLQTQSDGKQVGREISNKYDVSFWVAYVG